jgi:hypothetical protein
MVAHWYHSPLTIGDPVNLHKVRAKALALLVDFSAEVISHINMSTFAAPHQHASLPLDTEW